MADRPNNPRGLCRPPLRADTQKRIHMAHHSAADITDWQDRVEEATFDYTMGDADAAIAKLEQVVGKCPGYFDAWHALAEVYFSRRSLDAALAAAQKAHALRPDDVHINTSLSRIWMERGDKAQAEHFGAQARILGWKDQLSEDADTPE